VYRPPLQAGYWARLVFICLVISFLVSLFVASSAGLSTAVRLAVFLAATAACSRLFVNPEDRARLRAIVGRPAAQEINL
jgi:hypothetical protein